MFTIKSLKNYFSGSSDERDRLFTSLDAYRRNIDRETIYNEAFDRLKEGKTQQGLELLTRVAEDTHPVACVLLGIYYEQIKNKALSIHYIKKSKELFPYIEEKAKYHKQNQIELSTDLLVSLYWGYKQKLNKAKPINDDYSNEYHVLLRQLPAIFSTVEGKNNYPED